MASATSSMIGARPEDVNLSDSTSVTLFKTMVAACRMRPGRDVVVVESATFPTDGYIADAVARMLGMAHREDGFSAGEAETGTETRRIQGGEE